MKALVLLFLVALVASPAESRMVARHRHLAADGAGGEGAGATSQGAAVGVARVSPMAPPAPRPNENPDFPPGA